MTVMIPLENSAGMDSVVCGHFGSAPYFGVIDVNSGEIKIIANSNEHSDHGTCTPVDLILSQKADTVVCQGMGQRAILRLQESGINVFRTGAASINQILEELRQNTLTPSSVDDGCQGHGCH